MPLIERVLDRAVKNDEDEANPSSSYSISSKVSLAREYLHTLPLARLTTEALESEVEHAKARLEALRRGAAMDGTSLGAGT